MAQTLLMPKATAVWLVENTSLTFVQIAEFCHLHPLEVKSIADGEVAAGIKGLDPVLTGQLTREELEIAQKNPEYRLKLAPPKVRKGPRYTPLSRRHDRPNAILWLLRNHPELKDAQISRLVGTTKSTIQSIRDGSHWNSKQLAPMDPVTLGLCSQIELDFEVSKSSKDRPAVVEEPGQKLLPAETTTAKAPVESQPFADMSRPVREEEPQIDVDSVFAKLKGLKTKE
jgi:hypothetical protein